MKVHVETVITVVKICKQVCVYVCVCNLFYQSYVSMQCFSGDALTFFCGAVLAICCVAFEIHIRKYLALKGEHWVTCSASFPLLHLSHDLTISVHRAMASLEASSSQLLPVSVLLWGPLQRLLHSIIHVPAMSILGPPGRVLYCMVDKNAHRYL